MQEKEDRISSSDDTSSTEEENQGQGGSPGISKNLYECRLVTKDPEGAEIKISGQAFVNYKIQIPVKGFEDQEPCVAAIEERIKGFSYNSRGETSHLWFI